MHDHEYVVRVRAPQGTHLVATELDAVGECGDLLLGQLRELGQDGQDGGAGVATDNSDAHVSRVAPQGVADELVRAHDVERGDAKDAVATRGTRSATSFRTALRGTRASNSPARVVGASSLEGLGDDGHRGVDGVGDDAQVRVGRGPAQPRKRVGVSNGRNAIAATARKPHACTHSAAAFAKPWTIDALVPNRSSRVMPGLRGTPAGMTMMSAPSMAAAAFSAPTKPTTCATENVHMCTV